MITYTEEVLRHCICAKCKEVWTMVGNKPDETTCPYCKDTTKDVIKKSCKTCNSINNFFLDIDDDPCESCDKFLSNWEWENERV